MIPKDKRRLQGIIYVFLLPKAWIKYNSTKGANRNLSANGYEERVKNAILSNSSLFSFNIKGIDDAVKVRMIPYIVYNMKNTIKFIFIPIIKYIIFI